MLKRLFPWLILLELPFAAIHVHAGGGANSDGSGGGGNFIFANGQEAIRAIEADWQILTMARLDNPMIVAQRLLNRKKTRNSDEEFISNMLYKMTGFGPNESQLIMSGAAMQETFEDTDALKALRAKKINPNYQGPCAGPWHSTSAASVSKLSIDGEICVSIPEILKSTAFALKTDLLALLIHEIAHLNGYNETDAVRIQTYFKNNMDAVLRANGDSTRWTGFRKFGDVADDWRALLEYEKIGPDYAQTLMLFVAKFTQIAKELADPYASDDIKIARPERFPLLQESVEEAIAAGNRMYMDWAGRNLSTTKTSPVDARLLEDERTCILAAFEAERRALDYYFSDDDPYHDIAGIRRTISKEEALARTVTKPEALKDPKKQLGPETDPEKGDMYFFYKHAAESMSNAEASMEFQPIQPNPPIQPEAKPRHKSPYLDSNDKIFPEPRPGGKGNILMPPF